MDAAEVAPAQVVLFLGEHDDRTALGGFVGKRRELRGIRQALGADIGGGNELRCLAIAEGDGAGLVEQQRVDVARSFNGAAAHGEHVVLHQAIHAGDADGRKQSADRRRDEADQQRYQDEHGLRRLGVNGERLQRDHGQQEDDGQSRKQDRQRNLVGSLLARCAFDQRDHAVKKRFAGIGRDADLDPV